MRCCAGSLALGILCLGCQTEDVDPDGGAGETPPCRAVRPPDEHIVDYWSGTSFGELSGFHGFVYAYPKTLVETTEGGVLQVTGTVSDYSGIGVAFGTCTDASDYSAFVLTLGMIGGYEALDIVVRTSENTPGFPTTVDGSCEPDDPDDPFAGCLPAFRRVVVGMAPTRMTLPFSSFTGGVPHADIDPSQLLGIGLYFDWEPGQEPYDIQVTLGGLSFE